LISFGTALIPWEPLAEYSEKNIRENTTFYYASLYKKELWEKSGGYEKSLPWGAEDWNFWIACSKFGIQAKVIKENLFHYRFHQDGSMVTKVVEHFEEIKAMIKTLHPGLYPQSSLINAYKVIESMHPDTTEQLKKKTEKFKDLPLPYFWLGLYYEKQESIEMALSYYQKAAEFSKDLDWQPFLRLSYLYKELNDTEAAQRNFNEMQRRKKLFTG
jgi:tetratricopeptide (TPR) repeat protein